MKKAFALLLALLLLLGMASCGESAVPEPSPAESIELPVITAESSETPAPAESAVPAPEEEPEITWDEEDFQLPDLGITTEEVPFEPDEPEEAPSAEPAPSAETSPSAEPDEPAIDEDGVYTSRDDVALYLHTFGHLPDNFITKSEARDLGWSGGGLEPYAPGCCIGGDRFGNYEGNLPEGNYHECDIDTLGAPSRGAKRLVYTDTDIYYTEDHYNTFIKLY